jgi:hypothetical protein
VAAGAAATTHEKPARWGEEPQEPDWVPYRGVDEEGDSGVAAPAVGRERAPGAGATAVKADPAAAETAGGGSTADGGSLSRTGLELAALAAIGLGVLTLGFALRPRRRRHRRALR